MSSEMAKAVSHYVENHAGPDAASRTPAAGIVLLCSTRPLVPFGKIYRPSLCIVAQGAKRIEIQQNIFDYSAGMALVVSVELPGLGGITQASPSEPFLGLTIELDIALLRDVAGQMPALKPHRDGSGVFVEHLSDALQDCVVRLVKMLETPEATVVLYHSLMRELYYWLLVGPNGRRIASIVGVDSHAQRVAEAIHLMRGDLSRPLRIEDMARAALMGVSSFHHHFKTLTSMTPLQYYKQLRLLEARRLLAGEAANVADAAFRVGYESASQFSREYSRMFGVAPKKDAMALKSAGMMP